MRNLTAFNSDARLLVRNSCSLLLVAALLVTPLFAQKPDQSRPARLQPAALSIADLQRAAWDVLQKGIAAGSGSQRSDAIAALSSLGPNPRGLSLILGMLKDRDPAVREKAVAALDNLQVRSAIPQMRAALLDPSSSVRFTAAKALWDLGDPAGRNILIAVLQGKQHGTPGMWRSQLQQTSQQLRSPWDLGLLGAQEAAAVFFGPAALGVAVLGQMLHDHGAPTRAFCAELLGLDPSPQASAALARAARDKNWMVRASAAEGLGNVNRPNANALLQELLSDRKAPVRYMAAAAIIRLQTPPLQSGATEAGKR
jgi:HEAT repeat protein